MLVQELKETKNEIIQVKNQKNKNSKNETKLAKNSRQTDVKNSKKTSRRESIPASRISMTSQNSMTPSRSYNKVASKNEKYRPNGGKETNNLVFKQDKIKNFGSEPNVHYKQKQKEEKQIQNSVSNKKAQKTYLAHQMGLEVNTAINKIMSTYQSSYLSKYREVRKVLKKRNPNSVIPQISQQSKFVHQIDTEQFAEHLEQLENEYDRYINT